MSEKLPNMLENTISKVREMVDSNSVVGEPINVCDNLTIIPISKISIGLGGVGSDFAAKNQNVMPYGGGVGAGVKVTPLAFLIIKDGNVRMVPVAAPANTTADRIVELVPETLDKIATFVDNHTHKPE